MMFPRLGQSRRRPYATTLAAVLFFAGATVFLVLNFWDSLTGEHKVWWFCLLFRCPALAARPMQTCPPCVVGNEPPWDVILS